MEGEYIFTEHLITRLKERFPHLKLSWDDRWNLYKELNNLILNSYEEKRYLNDTLYILYLGETYGYDARYEFLVNTENGILFVVSLHHGTRKVVKTCMHLQDCQNFIPIKKYTNKPEKTRKIPKKRKGSLFNEIEAQEEYINDIIDNPGPIDIPKLTYKLILNKDTGKVHAIRCLKCKMISYNPNDIQEKYCGNCNQFHQIMSRENASNK